MSQFNINNVDLQDIINTYRGLHNQAFEANKARKGEILAQIDLTTQQLTDQYDTVENLMVDLGQTERIDIDRRETQEIARTEQDAISRGLSNTTIRDSLQRGVKEDSQRSRERVNRDVAQQRASIGLSEAGVLQQQGNFKANMLESFSDAYPDADRFTNLISSAAAGGPGATGGRARTSVGPGSSSFGRMEGLSNTGGTSVSGGGSGSGLSSFPQGVGGGGGGRTGPRTFGRNEGAILGGGRGGGSRHAGGSIGAASSAGIQTSYGGGGGPQRVQGTSLDNLFTGQDVFSRGDSIGTYAGDGQVNLNEGQNLIGANGEIDPNRVPQEQGGAAATPEEGAWVPLHSWYEAGEVVTKETQRGTGKTRIRKGDSILSS